MSNDTSGSGLIGGATKAKLSCQMTSFYQNADLNRSSGHEQHKDHTHFDFISTLALAQERNLDLLPFKWRPDMDDDPRFALGGGTSRINQLRVSIEMAMAFKIVEIVDDFKRLDYTKTYRALCHEIAILTSSQIREHPNIVQLEGLGWNVMGESVMPVLVLAKSSCGDASRFFASEDSRSLLFEEKLKLCIDIGNALMLLHERHIVHGDIKPENILIDRDSVGSFVAKVADFGYSSMYSIGELHALPRSRPWNAPEASSFEVSFQDAVSADIYSYAMVCLWILFQDKEVGRSSGTNRTWRLKDISSNVTAAEELKYLDEFKRISCKFVNGEEFLDPLRKHELCQFFEQTLIRIDVPGFNQRSRETNLITLKRLLGNGRFLNTSSINTYDIKDVDESTGIPQSDFQIGIGLLQISRLDYRVRQHIFSQLRIDAEEQNCANCRENAAYQTALCYRLGFGVKRDVRQASYWLTKSQRDGKFAEVVHFMSFTLGESHELLDDKDREKPYMDVEIMLLRLLVDDDPYHSAKMNSLYTNGVLASVDYAAEYSADGALVLEGVCDTYKREAADIAEELGYDHDVPFMIRNILSWLLKAAGQLKDAKKIAQEHYEFLKNQAGFGPEHSETITELSFLAELCHEEGDFEASLSQLQEVLAIQQKTMKPDDLNAMNTFNNLAEVYQDAGEYALAEDYANRALSGRLKILGEQNVDTLISMNNLGTTWIAQDKLDEAEELLSRAESVSTRILGETNYYTLTIVNNLGATLFFQDKFAEARDKLTTSLASCRITRGPSHPATSTSMMNLANFFISQGDNNAARELCKTAAQNLEQKLGREHPSTLEAKESMIRIAEGDHDYPLAEALSRSLLEISKHVLGENHTKTLNRADTLASMFMNSGKLSEAIELYQWVLQMKEMQLGKDDPQTLITVHNLGSAFNNQNRYKEAQELLLRAYEGFLVCRGPHHSSTLMSMGKLASAYGGLRKLDIAEKMAREAVAGFKQLERRNHEEEEDESEVGLLPDLSLERDDANLMGVKEINEDAMDESPSTLNAMLILGMILERGDRETEAEPLYRHILRGFESLFRPDSHDALATRVSLCRVLSEQGKYEAAMEMALRAESGLEELLGSDHPDTIFARSNVSNLKNRLREAEVRASKPQNN